MLLSIKNRFLFFFFLFVTFVYGQNETVFFGLNWNKLPLNWNEGAFIGNGNQGSMFYAEDSSSLRIDIGDSEIYNGESRIPLGKFIIKTEVIDKANIELDFKKACIIGDFNLENGKLKLRAFSDRNNEINRFEFKTETKLILHHYPLPAIESPFLVKKIKEKTQEKVIVDFSNSKYNDIIFKDLVSYHTKEIEGSMDSVNYRWVKINESDSYILLWSFELNDDTYSLNYKTHFFKNAKCDIKLEVKKFQKSKSKKFNSALKDNITWWTSFYNKSSIEIPDYKIANQYWAQLYKIGSATKPNGLPLDLMGPWFRATPWAKIWTNLNLQITYPIMSLSNHKESASTLFDYIDSHNNHFIDAVPKEVQNGNMATIGRAWAPYIGTNFFGESGNFIWILHNYSQFLRLFPNENREKKNYYPLLKKGVEFILTKIEKDTLGNYHFTPEISPEYKVGDEFPLIKDNNYNLALTHWALIELIYLEKKYNGSGVDYYQNILDNLTPLVIDDNEGLMLGNNFHFDIDHRHYSHLLAIYPLAIIDPTTSEGKDLILKSLNHFLTRPHEGWGYKGYTYTGAAAMYARIDEGSIALKLLNYYIDNFSERNTFYVETGPVIETPLSYAASVLELFVQNYGNNRLVDEFKVGTAIPKEWSNCTFNNLPVVGGHLISGVILNNQLVSCKINACDNEDREIKLILPYKGNLFKIKSKLNSNLKVEVIENFITIYGKLLSSDEISIN